MQAHPTQATHGEVISNIEGLPEDGVVVTEGGMVLLEGMHVMCVDRKVIGPAGAHNSGHSPNIPVYGIHLTHRMQGDGVPIEEVADVDMVVLAGDHQGHTTHHHLI